MSSEIRTPETSRKSLVSGLALIVLGLLLWAAQSGRFSFEMLFLPALGLVFLAWGLASRSAGLLVPGGVLSGIGLGAYLIEEALPNLSEPQKGGVFLLSFAAGWVLISLLSPFTGRFHFWPLIPASVMGLISGALLSGETGLKVLELLGQAWPLGLIVVGLYLIVWRRGQQK